MSRSLKEWENSWAAWAGHPRPGHSTKTPGHATHRCSLWHTPSHRLCEMPLAVALYRELRNSVVVTHHSVRVCVCLYVAISPVTDHPLCDITGQSWESECRASPRNIMFLLHRQRLFIIVIFLCSFIEYSIVFCSVPLRGDQHCLHSYVKVKL